MYLEVLYILFVLDLKPGKSYLYQVNLSKVTAHQHRLEYNKRKGLR